MTRKVEFNINQCVKVELTDKGRDIFYHQFDDINSRFGKQLIEPYYPKLDSDGYYETQMWCLMQLFGKHLTAGFGFDQPFSPNVILVVEEDEK